MAFEDQALWKALLTCPPHSPAGKSIAVSDLTSNQNVFGAYLHSYHIYLSLKDLYVRCTYRSSDLDVVISVG